MWRGFGYVGFLASAAALMATVACSHEFDALTQSDLANVRAWLNCDDCADGERDSVRSLGIDAIPVLREALFQTPTQEELNLRAQYSRLYAMQPPAGIDSATFVNRYLGSRRATASRRAAIALGDLGARNVLQQAADSLETVGDMSLATFVRGQTLRTGPQPSVSPGPAEAWAMVTPSVGVEVCNGLTTVTCSNPGSTDIAARADGPSGVFANPWIRVYFYGSLKGNPDPPELLSVAQDPVVTDDGIKRHYTWNASFGAQGWPPGAVEVFAVGVEASGEGHSTLIDSLITVVAGR